MDNGIWPPFLGHKWDTQGQREDKWPIKWDAPKPMKRPKMTLSIRLAWIVYVIAYAITWVYRYDYKVVASDVPGFSPVFFW